MGREFHRSRVSLKCNFTPKYAVPTGKIRGPHRAGSRSPRTEIRSPHRWGITRPTRNTHHRNTRTEIRGGPTGKGHGPPPGIAPTGIRSPHLETAVPTRNGPHPKYARPRGAVTCNKHGLTGTATRNHAISLRGPRGLINRRVSLEITQGFTEIMQFHSKSRGLNGLH